MGIFQSKNFLLMENLDGPLWSSSRKPPLMRGEEKHTYYICMQLRMIAFSHTQKTTYIILTSKLLTFSTSRIAFREKGNKTFLLANGC